MLFDLTFPCYLTIFSRKAKICPAYRSSPVLIIIITIIINIFIIIIIISILFYYVISL
jgi:hypothetical protein